MIWFSFNRFSEYHVYIKPNKIHTKFFFEILPFDLNENHYPAVDIEIFMNFSKRLVFSWTPCILCLTFRDI